MYRFTLGIGIANATRSQEFDMCEMFGISDDEWDSMSDDLKTDALDEQWRAWSSDYIDGGFEPID